jgi:hypothetical protein
MQIPVTTSGRIHPYHPNMRPRLYLALVFLLFLHTSVQAADVHVSYTCVEDDLAFAGLSCSDEPCPIYLELTAAAAQGQKLLVAGNLHSSSATLSSILLVSDDSGATWKEPTQRIRGAAIDQIQFLDARNAWAAGETQYPLARNPFVLITHDSGASWHQQPVGEDETPGSILRFHFDSPEHGELVVDTGDSSGPGRYLSYESETGGDNWMLTGKTGTLPKLSEAADSPIRLRASKDGKTLNLETRPGAQWTPVAFFPVEIANCRTP